MSQSLAVSPQEPAALGPKAIGLFPPGAMVTYNPTGFWEFQEAVGKGQDLVAVVKRLVAEGKITVHVK